MKTMREVFEVDKPIIGMLHLSGFGRDEVMEIARREIEIMYRNGVNAVLVENYFGDETKILVVKRDGNDPETGLQENPFLSQHLD